MLHLLLLIVMIILPFKSCYRNYINNLTNGANCGRIVRQLSDNAAEDPLLAKISQNLFKQPLTKEGAYEQAAKNADLPIIILVNPFLDQNVGSVARTMLNFGLHELRVVDPICDILSKDALALAAGGYEVLENAKIYTSLKDSIADCQRVFATTIRPRHMTQMILTPESAAKEAIISKIDNNNNNNNNLEPRKCAILFGRERSGLNNDEVAVADSIITIPVFRQFSSLNLAQAVNIIGYELWKRYTEVNTELASPNQWLHPRDGQRLAKRHELEAYFIRVERELTIRNFQIDDNRRKLCFQNIRNIFQRVLITKSEIDLLQGVLSNLIKENNINDNST